MPTFPRARYVAPGADWEFYTAPERALEKEFVRTDLLPLAEGDRVELVDEATVAEGVRLLPTPGHSYGHSVVLLSSEGQSVLVAGDLVHHRLQLEGPDLVHRWDVLPEQVPGSRRRMIRLALELDALVLPAHDPYPGLARPVPRGEGVCFCPIT